MAENLTPGTITTLGALRPGDVGELVAYDGDERFLVMEIGPTLATVRYPCGGYSVIHRDEPAYRFGRGRIESARIVMEGEADETMGIIADLRRKLAEAGVEGSPPPGRDTTIGQWSNRAHNAEEQVRTLRTAIREAWKNLNPARMVMNNTALDLFSEAEVQSGVLTAWEILNEYALAATAPKEKPCTT